VDREEHWNWKESLLDQSSKNNQRKRHSPGHKVRWDWPEPLKSSRVDFEEYCNMPTRELELGSIDPPQFLYCHRRQEGRFGTCMDMVSPPGHLLPPNERSRRWAKCQAVISFSINLMMRNEENKYSNATNAQINIWCKLTGGVAMLSDILQRMRYACPELTSRLNSSPYL